MKVNLEAERETKPEDGMSEALALREELTAVQAMSRLEGSIEVAETEDIPQLAKLVSDSNRINGITPSGAAQPSSDRASQRDPEKSLTERNRRDERIDFTESSALFYFNARKSARDEAQYDADICRLVLADLQSGKTYEELLIEYEAAYKAADEQEGERHLVGTTEANFGRTMVQNKRYWARRVAALDWSFEREDTNLSIASNRPAVRVEVRELAQENPELSNRDIYYILAKKYHPDVLGGSAEDMRTLTEWYEETKDR